MDLESKTCCDNCGRDMPPKGVFVLVRSEVIDGINLLLMDSHGYETEEFYEGEFVCGKECLMVKVSMMADELLGIRAASHMAPDKEVTV